LALLGWNPGDDQELMDMETLTDLFSLEKIVKSGARFDIDKAKWFNQQYLLNMKDEKIAELIKPLIEKEGIQLSDEYLIKMVELMKPRIELLPELISSSSFFFGAPVNYEEKQIRKKWKSPNKEAMQSLLEQMENLDGFEKEQLEQTVKGFIETEKLGFGNILPLLRIAVTGTMKGPDVFESMVLIGQKEVLKRIRAAFVAFDNII